jgi:hypothetical protein
MLCLLLLLLLLVLLLAESSVAVLFPCQVFALAQSMVWMSQELMHLVLLETLAPQSSAKCCFFREIMWLNDKKANKVKFSKNARPLFLLAISSIPGGDR